MYNPSGYMQYGPAYNAFLCFFCYLQDSPVFFHFYRTTCIYLKWLYAGLSIGATLDSIKYW